MATAVSPDFERHVSCLIVAFEFYPQMAIKMIKKTVNGVLKMIEKESNKKNIYMYLNYSEIDLILQLGTGGFNVLDMSLLYKLIRHYNLVSKPSKKWGGKPLATNMKQGDDIERMRINRNFVIHRPKLSLSEEERDTFFKESIEIACRLDKVIGDSTSSFETKIRNAKMYSITQDQSRQAMGKCPELQGQLRDISGIDYVNFYYGDDIVINLRDQDLPDTDSTLCTIYIRGENINGHVIRIMVAKVNEKSLDIKVVKTESGSLVLHVKINNNCFKTKDSLHKAIAEFLDIVFTVISDSLDQHIMEVVLAKCDSYIIPDNEEENDDYLNDQESLELQLGAMAMTRPQVDDGAKCTALPDDKDARATQEDKTKEDSNVLYRLLHSSECCGDGLCAKNPLSTTSIFDHVIKGSYGPSSKYISTCGSWEAMNLFRRGRKGRIAKIQKDKLPSSCEIIDLSREKNRYQYIDDDKDEDSIFKFHNFAKKFKVVLLVGHVPAKSLKLCDN